MIDTKKKKRYLHSQLKQHLSVLGIMEKSLKAVSDLVKYKVYAESAKILKILAKEDIIYELRILEDGIYLIHNTHTKDVNDGSDYFYDFFQDYLKDLGLELIDYEIKHYCVSGYLKLIDQ